MVVTAVIFIFSKNNYEVMLNVEVCCGLESVVPAKEGFYIHLDSEQRLVMRKKSKEI